MRKPKKWTPKNSDKNYIIHTSIKGNIYNKLLKLGNGYLNHGINKLINITEKNEKCIKKQLLDEIINEALTRYLDMYNSENVNK